MAYQLGVALQGGESEAQKKLEARNKEVSKLAWRPSKRQRMLESVKAERIAGRDELLYKGEDLKRRPR